MPNWLSATASEQKILDRLRLSAGVRYADVCQEGTVRSLALPPSGPIKSAWYVSRGGLYLVASVLEVMEEFPEGFSTSDEAHEEWMFGCVLRDRPWVCISLERWLKPHDLRRWPFTLPVFVREDSSHALRQVEPGFPEESSPIHIPEFKG